MPCEIAPLIGLWIAEAAQARADVRLSLEAQARLLAAEAARSPDPEGYIIHAVEVMRAALHTSYPAIGDQRPHWEAMESALERHEERAMSYLEILTRQEIL